MSDDALHTHVKYEALPHPDGYWRVRCHGDDPVQRPNGTNGLFFITGLAEAQARAVAVVLNNLESIVDSQLSDD